MSQSAICAKGNQIRQMHSEVSKYSATLSIIVSHPLQCELDTSNPLIHPALTKLNGPVATKVKYETSDSSEDIKTRCLKRKQSEKKAPLPLQRDGVQSKQSHKCIQCCSSFVQMYSLCSNPNITVLYIQRIRL